MSIFGLVNDPDRNVELIVDESLWKAEAFQFHPLVNTSTLVVSSTSLKRFLALTGHDVKVLRVPAQR